MEIPGLQSEADGFGPFIYVGVGEYGAVLLGVALANQAAEVVHASVGLDQVMHGGNATSDIDFAARAPESFFDGHRVDGDVAQLGVRRLDEILNRLIAPGWRGDQWDFLPVSAREERRERRRGEGGSYEISAG